MKESYILVIIFIAFALFVFVGSKICVFSAVKIQITKNGKPIKNAQVIRRWEWNNPDEDISTTNEKGYVEFPAVFERSIARLLPVEVVIGQQLSVQINGEENVFWTNGKREAEENSEYGGAEFIAVCEVSDEEVLVEDYGSLMLTKCKLDISDKFK